MVERLTVYHSSVWDEFTSLAVKHNAVNLGSGFPSYGVPYFVKEALVEAVQAEHNQYARTAGAQILVTEIARVYSPKYHRQIDPMTEVLVTFGATEAISIAFRALLNEGDEVVLFDPSYDCYAPNATLAGAEIRYVRMLPPSLGSSVWEIDWPALEQAFTSRTRLIMINSPSNPLGKVFTDEEFGRIAGLLARWPDVWVISDEVYAHLTYDGRRFHSICTYGDLWSRCGTVSSAGKLFSVTGWKTGWIVGGTALIQRLTTVKQWVTNTSNTPCQYAIAKALQRADQPYEGCPDYYSWLQLEYVRKRSTLISTLQSSSVLSFDPITPEGGFFVVARIKSADGITDKYLENASWDFAVAKWLTVEYGVTAIPCSCFFAKGNKDLGTNFLRFAICKQDSDYTLTRERLCPPSKA